MPLTLKDHEKRIQELENVVALLRVRLDEIGAQNARNAKTETPPPKDRIVFRRGGLTWLNHTKSHGPTIRIN